ncbi:hypothetical protein M422DRAFT_242142, partial [Sphaerobolus stellatus SS14]
VFVSPNARYLPSAALAERPSQPRWDYRTFQLPVWTSEAHPYLAFMPQTPRYVGPIFKRLALDDLSKVIYEDAGVWRIDRAFINSWCRLEIGMLYFACVLVYESKYLVSINWEWPRLPSRLGLDNPFSTYNAAENKLYVVCEEDEECS